MNPVERYADFDLREHNTMGIAAHARPLFDVYDTDVLPDLWREFTASPLIIGSGSNVVFAADPSVPVVRLRNNDVEWLSDDGDRIQLRVGAGKVWHELVMETVQQGLYGIENLALIPGTVGACPIQNIGAYGVEVNSVVDSVRAFEPATGEWHHLSNEDCRFAYRDSMFKDDLTRFVITDVTFSLWRHGEPKLDYANLRELVTSSEPTSREIADAVIAIRSSKLPDPAKLGNSGSFFKNPIVDVAFAEQLHALHDKMPMFRGSSENTRKLSAAWLIEQAGWKGHRDGDAGVAPGHALVVVNYGNATGAQIMQLADRIADSVEQKFGVRIEPEPRVIR